MTETPNNATPSIDIPPPVHIGLGIIGCLFGGVIAAGLTLSAVAFLSNTWFGPAEHFMMQIGRWIVFLPLLLFVAALIGLFRRKVKRATTTSTLVGFGVGALFAIVVPIVGAATSGNCPLLVSVSPNLDVSPTLYMSLPVDWTKSYLTYDAQAASASGPGGGVHYVQGNVASTDSNTVSVHPIDADNWAAAAYSSLTHQCYALLYNRANVSRERVADEAVLSPSEPCRGDRATQQTVTSKTSFGFDDTATFMWPNDRRADNCPSYDD